MKSKEKALALFALFLIGCVVLGFTAAGAAEDKKNAAKDGKEKEKKEMVQLMRLYDFETDIQDWYIPEWCFKKDDNAAVMVSVSKEKASTGQLSLKLGCKFLPLVYSQAYTEVSKKDGFYDLTGYKDIKADVFVPKEATKKFKGELVLTILTEDEEWEWTEVRKPISLVNGEWTMVSANIHVESTDWKQQITKEKRSRVKRIGVRVSTYDNTYTGPVYIDNIRLESSNLGW